MEHVLSVHGAEIDMRAGTSSDLLIEKLTTSPVSFVAKLRNLFDHGAQT